MLILLRWKGETAAGSVSFSAPSLSRLGPGRAPDSVMESKKVPVKEGISASCIIRACERHKLMDMLNIQDYTTSFLCLQESSVFGVESTKFLFALCCFFFLYSNKIRKFPHTRLLGPITDLSVIHNGSGRIHFIIWRVDLTTFHIELEIG